MTSELNNSKPQGLNIPLSDHSINMIPHHATDMPDDEEVHHMSPSSRITMANPFSMNSCNTPKFKPTPSHFQSYINITKSEEVPDSLSNASLENIPDEKYIPCSISFSIPEVEKDKIVWTEESIFGDEDIPNSLNFLIKGLENFKKLDMSGAEKNFVKTTSLSSSDSRVVICKAQAFENLGRINEIYGNYDLANTQYQKALSLASNQLGEKHVYCAQILDRIAMMKLNLCEFEEAEKLASKASGYRSSLPDKDDPLKSLSYMSLAMVHTAYGNYKGAIESAKNAINLLSDDDLKDSEDCLLLLGRAHYILGYIQFKMQAIDHSIMSLETALKFQTMVISPEHPIIAPLYNTLILASYYFGSKKKEVLDYIKMAQKCTKFANNNSQIEKLKLELIIGTIDTEKSDYSNAYDKIENCYSLFNKEFPKDHLEKAHALFLLGNIFISSGDPKKAIKYYEDSIVMRKKIQGPSHPDLIESLVALASVYVSLSRDKDALDIVKNQLTLILRHYTENHPTAAMCYHGIGFIYFLLEHYQIALTNLTKAFLAFREYHGKLFYTNIEVCDYIGHCNKKLNEFRQAIQYYKYSLETRQKLAIQDNSKLIEGYTNLALVFSRIQDFAKSIEYFEKAISLTEQTYGSNHPDIGALYLEMGNVAEENKDYELSCGAYKNGLDHMLKFDDFTEDEVLIVFERLAELCHLREKSNELVVYQDKILKKFKKKPSNNSKQENSYFIEKLEKMTQRTRTTNKRATFKNYNIREKK